MKSKNYGAVQRMIDNIDKALRYTNDLEYEEFINNTMIIDATVFAICQIGECVKNVSDDIISEYSDVKWYVLKGIRNRIVHDYDGINFELIWDIVKEDLIPLKNQLSKILREMK